MEEMIDALDEEGNFLETLPRSVVRERNLAHEYLLGKPESVSQIDASNFIKVTDLVLAPLGSLYHSAENLYHKINKSS